MKKLCKNIEVGTVLVIEAIDHSTYIDLMPLSEAKEAFPLTLLYIGVFLSEDKEFIRMASMRTSTTKCKYIHIIPKACVMWIEVVVKTEDIYNIDKFDESP